MKKINYTKLILDLVLGTVFALLFNHRVFGGLNFHEIAGLAIGFAVLVHLLLNAKWIKNVTSLIFSKKITIKTRIGYILNILLFLDFAIIIISGIFISKILFPNSNIQNSFFNQRTHVAASYIALGLIGIHVGLHWHWVISVIKKIFKIGETKKAVGYVARVIAILVLAFGIYNIVSIGYFQHAAQMFSVSSSSSYQHSQSQGFNQQGGQNDGAAYYHRGSSNNNANSGGAAYNHSGPSNGNSGGTGRPSYVNNGGGAPAVVNPVSVLATYLSVMAVFAVCVYYVDQILLNSKRRKCGL